MELQLQVTEEELLEFPEVRSDQITTSHSDKPAGKVVLCTKNSTEKKSSLSSSRSHGRCSADTHSKIKVEKPYYKQSRKQKQKDRRLATDKVHIPSIFDIKVRPNLMAFAKTLTPIALRYLYLGIDLGWTIGNCPQ